MHEGLILRALSYLVKFNGAVSDEDKAEKGYLIRTLDELSSGLYSQEKEPKCSCKGTCIPGSDCYENCHKQTEASGSEARKWSCKCVILTKTYEAITEDMSCRYCPICGSQMTNELSLAEKLRAYLIERGIKWNTTEAIVLDMQIIAEQHFKDKGFGV